MAFYQPMAIVLGFCGGSFERKQHEGLYMYKPWALQTCRCVLNQKEKQNTESNLLTKNGFY